MHLNNIHVCEKKSPKVNIPLKQPKLDQHIGKTDVNSQYQHAAWATPALDAFPGGAASSEALRRGG